MGHVAPEQQLSYVSGAELHVDGGVAQSERCDVRRAQQHKEGSR
jgi:hypothetical protein